MTSRVTIGDLAAMKRDGRKIVGVVAWDTPMARIADRVGVEIVSVGDTVGVNLWGREHPLQVSLDEMILLGRAVRRGVTRALVSCDFPFGPLQEGTRSAVRAAIRLVKRTGADMVKLDGAADFVDAVAAITRAGIPVFAQFGLTPQTALRHGLSYDPSRASGDQVPEAMTAELVEQAQRLEAAGAALLNFTNSGPVAGAAVAAAVSVPVIGGFGGGPWLDGRMRLATAAIGYGADNVDGDQPGTYANVARVAYDALAEYAADVRAGRQIGRPGAQRSPSRKER